MSCKHLVSEWNSLTRLLFESKQSADVVLVNMWTESQIVTTTIIRVNYFIHRLQKLIILETTQGKMFIVCEKKKKIH